MPYDQSLLNRIQSAARARDLARVEELWVELQTSQAPLGEVAPFFEVARELHDRGDRDKAAELLLMLKEDLRAAGRDADLLEVMRRAVVYSARVKGIRDELTEAYRKVYGARAGFDAVLGRTGLTADGNLQDAVRQLDHAFGFDVGDFVFHTRGWGIGRVVECRPEAGEFVIDFARNRGQRMEASMAVAALQRRSQDDLDVLLWTDKDRVRVLAEEDPLKLLRAALESAGGKLASRDLKDKLVDIVDKGGWTKFWGRAKKLAKDDPRLEIGAGPRGLVSLRDAPLSREDEAAAALRKLRAFADVLELARRELLELQRDGLPEQPPAWLTQALEQLGKNHGKVGSPEQRAAAIELALFREEVAKTWPGSLPGYAAAGPQVDPETGEPLPDAVPEPLRAALDGLSGAALPPVLRAIETADYRRRATALIAQVLPADAATATLRHVVLDPANGTWEEAVAALKRLGRDDVIAEAANVAAIRPADHAEAFIAMTRLRFNGRLEVLTERPDSELLAKAIQLLDVLGLELRGAGEKNHKAALKATIDQLRTVLSEKNQRAIGQVIQNGSEAEVRRILQLVRQSPAVTPTMIRATENFVVHRFPELLATVVAAPRHEDAEPETTIYTTLEGRKRYEQELQRIMDVELEKVRLEIGRALEFGDISENSELDAARERQQRLAEQAERMRKELERVMLIDPNKVETDQVRVGTRVTAEQIDEVGESEGEVTYTVLGPWDVDDADPTIVSHLSPVASGFLGASPGDEVKVRLPDGGEARYRIKTIERALLQRT